MLRERNSAWFFNPSFRQGRQIFEDYGFRTGDIREYWENNDRRIESSKKDLCGIEKPDVCAREMKTGLSEQMSEAMRHTGKSVCYLTPSQMTVWGEVMPVGDRMKLLKDAAREDMLIIEDDYNSEFRYYNRPTPSLQGLSGGRGRRVSGDIFKAASAIDPHELHGPAAGSAETVSGAGAFL